MIFGISWAVWLNYLLAAFFLVNSVVNLINPRATRDEYARLDLPRWINFVNAAVEISCAVLLAFPPTRPLGLALGALLCFAIFAVLIRKGEFGHLVPGSVLLAVIGVIAYGLYG